MSGVGVVKAGPPAPALAFCISTWNTHAPDRGHLVHTAAGTTLFRSLLPMCPSLHPRKKVFPRSALTATVCPRSSHLRFRFAFLCGATLQHSV